MNNVLEFKGVSHRSRSCSLNEISPGYKQDGGISKNGKDAEIEIVREGSALFNLGR